jgi:hypothetical protein
MQVQFDDITSGKRLLRQGGEEEFVDDARTRDANPALLCAGRMSRYHYAAVHTLRPHRHIRTVVEATHDLAFRALLGLIGRQVQPCLDERMIENRVLFAAGHKGEASEIGEGRPGAILSIEPQQRMGLWELMCHKIATNGRQALAQFLPVASITFVPKTAEPTSNRAPD